MFYLTLLEIPFNSLTYMVSCAEILCWSFLERINYLISFDVRVFRICRFVFSAFRLGPFGTNLYFVNLMGVVLTV